MSQSTFHFLGIDVSKPWFDCSLMAAKDHQRQPMSTERFENTTAGLKVFHKWLVKQGVKFNENSLLVIENTGVYHRLLWQYCSKHHLPLHIGNAARIKWSLGITRGKNDVIDSQRLCSYAFRQADELKATPVLNPAFMQLKDLMTARTALVKQLHGMQNYLRELKSSHDKALVVVIERAHRQAIEGIKKSISNLEEQIQKIITADKTIYANYQLIKTVPGIGHLTAVYLICCTNNFAGGVSGKQLASYAGVVPYEHRSGTSIKGKPRVHKMATSGLINTFVVDEAVWL